MYATPGLDWGKGPEWVRKYQEAPIVNSKSRTMAFKSEPPAARYRSTITTSSYIALISLALEKCFQGYLVILVIGLYICLCHWQRTSSLRSYIVAYQRFVVLGLLLHDP